MWFSDGHVQRLDLSEGYTRYTPELKKCMPKDAGEELFVPDGHFAIVSVAGLPRTCLEAGRYILWKQREQVTAECFDTSDTFSSVPFEWTHLVPAGYIRSEVVYPYLAKLLYIDGQLIEVLQAGRYTINAYRKTVHVVTVDLREKELQIPGQEVMTADKVSLRITLLNKYKVVDARTSEESVASLHDAMYSTAQMIARHWIARYTVDELLERRKEATEQMTLQLTEQAASWGVEILSMDLKDIVFPGEMKTLMNRVFEAEKEAAAQLILRREETAATRSLANTAKMLEKNPMLMRLKELEHMREMASSVQQLTIVAGGSELMQHLISPTTKQD